MSTLTFNKKNKELQLGLPFAASSPIREELKQVGDALRRHVWESRPRLSWRDKTIILALGVGFLAANGAEPTPAIATPMTIAAEAPIANYIKKPAVVTPKRFEVIEVGDVQTKVVSFGSLVGENFGTDLNAKYAGVKGHAPEFAEVNYLGNLGKLYLQKLAWKNVSPATQKAVPIILDRYRERRTLTDLVTYTNDINNRIVTAHASFNMDGLCARLQLDRPGETAGCELFKELAPKITGEHLVAYSMTEIMPRQRDGAFNARFYDHLLRSGGMEYIGSLPALYDKYLSVGGWQFTSFAVREDASGAHGASLVSKFATPEHQIPGSVMNLIREDHDRAAYYFSLYNVGRLIGCSKKYKGEKISYKCATDKQRAAFRQLIATPQGVDQVAQYTAIAHHLPAPARDRTRTWLGKGAKGSLRDHLGPKLTVYAIKSHYNLKGLRDFLKEAAPLVNNGGQS